MRPSRQVADLDRQIARAHRLATGAFDALTCCPSGANEATDQALWALLTAAFRAAADAWGQADRLLDVRLNLTTLGATRG